jgi:monomeric isocitrate dehydrogenase
MGLLRLMTDEQLARFQQLAGLAVSPLLRTGNSWREALLASGPIPPQR